MNSPPHRIWKSSGVSCPRQAWTRQGTTQKHRKYNWIIVIINWIPHLSVDSLQRWVQLILQVEERRSGGGLFDWVRQSHDTPVISKPLPSLQKSQTLTLQITAFVYYRIIFIDVCMWNFVQTVSWITSTCLSIRFSKMFWFVRQTGGLSPTYSPSSSR